MNLCYKVFHIDGMGESAEIRQKLYNDINNYLKDYFKEIDTPTIKISNQEEYNHFNNNYIQLNPTFEFKYGELGIWASNLLAMKNFLNTDYDYLMLMEDDITFNTNFAPLLINYMNNLPEDWDVFSYFCHQNQNGRFKEQEGDIVLAYQDWSMLCYIINKKSANKILNDIAIRGVFDPLDWYIFRQPELFKSYTISPTAERGCELYETASTFQQTDERVKLNDK